MEQNIPPRILIVEGYIGSAKSLSSSLGGLAVKPDVVSANEGELALNLLEKETVNLLIIDSCLKGKMDGYDLCRAIRSFPRFQQLPVILLLAGSLILHRSKGMSAGADLLVHKPILKEELCKMVQLLMEWRSHELFGPRLETPDRDTARRLRSVKMISHSA